MDGIGVELVCAAASGNPARAILNHDPVLNSRSTFLNLSIQILSEETHSFSMAMKACVSAGIKSLLGFLPFILGGLILLATAGCRSGGTTQAAFAVPPPLVTVVRADSRDVPVYLDEI